MKSICAGISISIGCIAFLLSPIKIIGALLFCVGLLSIVVHRFTLFTGTISSVTKSTIMDNIGILLYNILGVIILALIFVGTGISTDVNVIVASKLSADIIEVFCKAILCNMLICLAVDEWKNTQNSLIVILCVTVFVFCGFEHCIANTFYMLVANNFSIKFLIVNVLGNAFGGIMLWRLKHIREIS